MRIVVLHIAVFAALTWITVSVHAAGGSASAAAWTNLPCVDNTVPDTPPIGAVSLRHAT